MDDGHQTQGAARTVHVHIGMHKTGSTSIQATFGSYDDGRIAYLQLPQRNHSLFVATMFMARPEAHKSNRGRSASALARARVDLRARAQKQFDGNRKDFILSGEYFSMGFQPGDIADLKAFLAPHFDRIHVIVYVRDPFSYMRSQIQQKAKNDRFAFNMEAAFPLYSERLGPWFDAFPAEDVDIVMFDPASFPNGDVVQDFARRIGVDLAPGASKRANESMSAESYALRYFLRWTLQRKPLNPLKRAWARLALPLAEGYGTARFEVGREERLAVIARHADEVRWIEQRLGRTFPAPPESVQGVVFRNEDDVLRYAGTLLPAFRAHCRDKLPLSVLLRDVFRPTRARSR
ncbi:MAG: hypothetical protein RLZZ528_2583 [Pseudomonadota bacterium]